MNESPSHADAMDEAEGKVLATIERLERQLAQAKIILANMRTFREQLADEVPGVPHVRPGQYQGMRPVDALESYLRIRKGNQVPLPKIVADLVVGGVNPGAPRGRKNDPAGLIEHTLKISLPPKGGHHRMEAVRITERHPV